MPRKVFTAGEVLAAADVNEFLMDQTIMTFAGTAARGSAIGTATEGMYAHLNDTDTLTYYDGSAWVNAIPADVAPGLTLLNTTDFSAVASQSINDVFSSTYDSYRIVYNVTAASASGVLRLRMRVSGTDNSDNLYTQAILYIPAFGVSAPFGSVAASTSTFFEGGSSNSSHGGYGAIEIASPFATTTTRINALGAGDNLHVAGGGLRNNTSYTGFSIIATSGNITGNVKTYGYRKS